MNSVMEDIDDGDHEESFLERNHQDLQRHSHQLNMDSMDNMEHASNAQTAQEIQVLKHSVSTLIDTVSKLEELVLFYKRSHDRSDCEHCSSTDQPLSMSHGMDSQMDLMSEEIECLKQRVKDLECG